MYMLDTNIFIDFLRGRSPRILEMLQSSDTSLFKVPSIVKAELLLGANKSNQPVREQRRVEDLLLPFEIVPFDESAAYQYAKIRAELESAGETIGANDYLIAATALANSAILVTNNVNEFKRVPGLMVESWVEEDI